jgi:hypothetical protein
VNLRTMIAVLATATTGIVLLTAASHAQGTDLNASAATAPKARSDTAHPASAAKRKPDSSAAPSTHTMGEAGKSEAANAAKVQPGKGPDKAR